MRLILILTFMMSGWLAHSAEEPISFEKAFQNFGKKLDEAKAKGKELSAEAKKEWEQIRATTEDVTDEAATKTEAKTKDWGTRLKNAAAEFGEGVKNAWNKLKGEP